MSNAPGACWSRIVGDLAAGRLRSGRADRHVVRLRARRRQRERDRDEGERDSEHGDDAGRADRGRWFVHG